MEQQGAVSCSDDVIDILEVGLQYVSTHHFEGQEIGDLPFKEGEVITIIEPSEMMFWYIGKNSAGQTGTVPGTLFKSIEANHDSSHAQENEYEKMTPATPSCDTDGYVTTGPSRHMTKAEREIAKVQQREKERRLPKDTLLMATTTYEAEMEEDLSFKIYDEVVIIEPMPDLGWYLAKKCENHSVQGIIPITHFRLVYLSDDEEDEEDVYKEPIPQHDKLYDDLTDFINQSGWFTCHGLPLGKNALLHMLASKCTLSHAKFMQITEAVYVFNYMGDEKVFVGKAEVLHKELMKHFECFGLKRKEIREIDDELCHHTYASSWELRVYEIEPDQVLEVEWAKKIIMNNALVSEDGTGINDGFHFSNMNNFDLFWKWLSPN